MDKAEKRRFIEDLCDSIKQSVVDSISKMPEEWNGVELRELIADKARYSAYLLQQKNNRKRLKSYRNEVLVRGL
jgi:hypothetical protein